MGIHKSFASFLYPYWGSILGAFLALIFTAGITLTFGQEIRALVDEGLTGLNTAIFVFFIIALLLGLGSFGRFFLINWVGERLVADLRQACFQRLLYFPISFFEKQRVGEVQSKIIQDAAVIQQFIGGGFSSALRNGLILLGSLSFLFIGNPKLTGIAFLMMLVILIPLIFLGRKIKLLSKENQTVMSVASGFIHESVQNVRTIQAYNQEIKVGKRLSKYINTVLKVAKQRIFQRAVLTGLAIVLILSLVLSLLWLGAYWVSLGELTSGELAAFLFYAILAASSAGTLSEFYGEYQQTQGAFQRLWEIQQIPSLSVSTTQTVSFPDNSAEIIIRDISFSYSDSQEILHDISLEVKAGQSLGIVGSSGAGKSTLLSLLLGFYKPSKGMICLDGQDITQIPLHLLREQIAWVSQSPAIFSGTLWENLCYSNPDADKTVVLSAAKLAYVDEFAQHLPLGYETLIGEGGVTLSAGQCQRIGLARAFLKKPRLLLLDEPTHALDAISEKLIQDSLEVLGKHCTMIMITHRLGMTKILSRIAVMEQGRIAAVGTHEELMQSSALYSELARLQFID